MQEMNRCKKMKGCMWIEKMIGAQVFVKETHKDILKYVKVNL